MWQTKKNGEWDFSPEEVKRLRTNCLDSRVRIVLIAYLSGKRLIPSLCEATEIPLETWRSWWKKGISPSGSIVEAVAKKWPQHAYWIVTGMTDNYHGHFMPELPNASKGYIDSMPEQASLKSPLKNDYAAEYLKTCLELHAIKMPTARYEILEKTLFFTKEKRMEETIENNKIPMIGQTMRTKFNATNKSEKT